MIFIRIIEKLIDIEKLLIGLLLKRQANRIQIITEFSFTNFKVKGNIMAFTLNNPTAEVASQPIFDDGSDAPFFAGSFNYQSGDNGIFTIAPHSDDETKATMTREGAGSAQLMISFNPDPTGATNTKITKTITINIPATQLASGLRVTIDGQVQE